jgi:BCD family chlorophyll transporter-like MFS transporter
MPASNRPTTFGWWQIVRLGLVQACLGAVVVMTTSTLNRVMVVELALPALVPGALVALHYLVQMLRPRLGHGSDQGGRRTPWMTGGMAVLAAGGSLAALATGWMGTARGPGLALAVLAFLLIGLGVGACGTSLLVLLAKRVVPERRAAAATVVWLMMIMGFALTSGTAGRLLDPYTPERLVAVTSGVCAIAFLLTVVALWRLEGQPQQVRDDQAVQAKRPNFGIAIRQVWADPTARLFTVFIFVSMLAYSAQDLILEPFAGSVFGYTPGRSTQLSGVQHGGVLVGMLLATLAGRRLRGISTGSLKAWIVGGCLLSALAMGGLVMAGLQGPGWPFVPNVVLLGVANGAFSIAAIGLMMALAGQAGDGTEGVRMGLWGASQAVAFGLGGIVGTGASDLARWLISSPGPAYGAVFAAEGLLFGMSAVLAWRIKVAVGAGAAATGSGSDRDSDSASARNSPAPRSAPSSRSPSHGRLGPDLAEATS